MVDVILVYSPKKELKILADLASEGDRVDWKPAIILSAAYLEKAGHERLKRHFEKKKIRLMGKLERLSLPDVAIQLYGLSLISDTQFTHINQIWAERRSIVHPKGTLPAYIGEEANKKYGEMIRNALRIINFLEKRGTNKP